MMHRIYEAYKDNTNIFVSGEIEVDKACIERVKEANKQTSKEVGAFCLESRQARSRCGAKRRAGAE